MHCSSSSVLGLLLRAQLLEEEEKDLLGPTRLPGPLALRCLLLPAALPGTQFFPFQ